MNVWRVDLSAFFANANRVFQNCRLGPWNHAAAGANPRPAIPVLKNVPQIRAIIM
jgi:hypothetical protein